MSLSGTLTPYEWIGRLPEKLLVSFEEMSAILLLSFSFDDATNPRAGVQFLKEVMRTVSKLVADGKVA